MQRSSSSIGNLAAALAKAQALLVNPEKSLEATLRPRRPGETEQTFRYAPLSSGLDIVRKTLGQHEIATMQTTSIDPAAGVVNLTTLLAHASGEWIASDWPVCSTEETSSPHRMGAALTYARRYALFALVGIAGEDDLDAPDLTPSPDQAPKPERPVAANKSPLNGHRPAPRSRRQEWGNSNERPFRPQLEKQLSATLREQLVGQIVGLGSTEEAALWAHRSMATKNTLTADDARLVEEAYQARLTALGGDAIETVVTGSAAEKQAEVDPGIGPRRRGTHRTSGIDKSSLPLPEPRRIRDRDHVKAVARHPCLVCGRRPADAHHLRFAQSRALGRKVSDEFTVPLCRGHHREVHRSGDEMIWWEKTGIDPAITARVLWLERNPLLRDKS